MDESDGTDLCKIRVLLNAIETGETHVDYQNTAHDNQTLLIKLCYLEFNEVDLLEILDEIMARNPNVNARDIYGRTALIHACIAQDYIIADCLLYHDFTIIDAMDKEFCTALTYAIRLNDSVMVEKILSQPKARTSNLLTTKTNGKTPLELATFIGNEAVINIMKTMQRCSSSTSDAGSRTVTSPIESRPSLPEVRVPRALARAFVVAKSYIDPLRSSTRKDQNTQFTHRRPVSGDSCFSDIAGSNLNSKQQWDVNAAPVKGDTDDQSSLKYTNNLPVLLPSTQRHSRRRGSVSLPDLTCLPSVLMNVHLEDESDSDQESSDSENSKDIQSDFDDSEDFRNRTTANRRKNSVSLPDLCAAPISNFAVRANAYPRSGVADWRLASTDCQSTNQISSNIQCRQKKYELRLPDIHLCQSPSLPALDRISLSKQRAVHNLNSSVRRSIDGETENLRKRLRKKKTNSVM